MRFVRICLYLVLIIIGVSFAALNSTSVNINFYFSNMTMPISVLITISLGFGLLIGLLLFAGKYWQLKVTLLRIKNQLKMTEKEIKNLRDIPLKNHH